MTIAPMPREQYHAIDAISGSRLENGWIDGEFSPLHYRHAMILPDEPSAAMQLGTATHLAILEPERLDSMVVRSPDFNTRSNAGKAERDAFAAANPGKIIVDSAEWERLTGMREMVRKDPLGSRLVKHVGLIESAVLWTDAATGLPCKGLMDKYVPGRAIVDLKTVGRRASRHRLRSIINDFGYHRKMAHYLAGVKACGAGDAVSCWWIFVESEAPHAVRVMECEPEALQIGALDNAESLAAVSACEKADNWPAYRGGVCDIGLPEWVYKRRQFEEKP